MGRETTKTGDRTSLPRCGSEVRHVFSFCAAHLQFSSPKPWPFAGSFPGSFLWPPDPCPCPHSVLIVHPAARIILLNCKQFLTLPFNFWLPIFRIWPLLTSPAHSPSPSRLYAPGKCSTKQFLESSTPPGFYTCCLLCLALSP